MSDQDYEDDPFEWPVAREVGLYLVEQPLEVRVQARLDQLADAVPFHQNGIGQLAGECLKCTAAWPCEGYAREVGDL